MSSFGGTSVLVVGGAGFVGSNLVRAILAQEPRRIHIVDNLLSSESDNLPRHPRLEATIGSIADDGVLARLPSDFDYVFHLACFHGNQSSIHNPIADHDNNTITSLKLFDRIKDGKAVRKVVYSAAGCAVAEKTFDVAAPTPEDAPVSLFHDSPYSISKLIGEMYGNFYFQHYGMPFVKARFQNVYGPGEILGAGQWRGTPATVWRNVTPTFIWKAVNREALPVENGGIQTRDFIYVGDIVRGLVACALGGEPGEVYNLASGTETSILQLAALINELSENPTPIALKPARDWDTSGKRFGDPTKAKVKLGFAAETTVREGLIRTIEWTRANRDLISRCIRRHATFLPELHTAAG